MKFSDHYPLIVTPHKNACRDFWVTYLKFNVGFDSDWFLWLSAQDGSASIAFMTPDHPSAPPGPEVFSGKGMCFELQVDSAQAAHDEMKALNAPIVYPLTDELFGQKRFGFFDPSGLWIDVVEQIGPAAGYWDVYINQAKSSL